MRTLQRTDLNNAYTDGRRLCQGELSHVKPLTQSDMVADGHGLIGIEHEYNRTNNVINLPGSSLMVSLPV